MGVGQFCHGPLDSYWQTVAMSQVVHPFSAGGGGPRFEWRVATLIAAGLLLSRQSEYGGAVSAIELQTGPPGYDDLQLTVELLDGGHRTVHVQCRHKQPFRASDDKFAKLIGRAADAVTAQELAFAGGERRLAVVVDRSSPAHDSMRQLCEIARGAGDPDRFVNIVEQHRGHIEKRWEQCRGASPESDPAVLHRVLMSLEVHAVEVDSPTARDSVELINRLAGVWPTRDPVRATTLANALYVHLSDIGPMAGVVDQTSLQSHLGAYLPGTLGSNTRRERLQRRREAGHRRIARSLLALGLDSETAELLATRVLTDAPSIDASGTLTVVCGPMGVGKTTELERLHRLAVDRALEDPSAPIPVILEAREVAANSLMSIAREQAQAIGDPARVGVCMVIDGLDEAGVHVADLSSRIATMRAEWPNSSVIVGTRPQSSMTGRQLPEPVMVEPMTSEAAQELMAVVNPDVAEVRWFRDELTEILRRPLFAIRHALDHRQGRLAGIDEGQIVASVAEHALDDLGDTTDDMFDLLVSLACEIVSSGGQAVDAGRLRSSPAQVARLLRSRVVQAPNGQMSFQLAALTEWFAAHGLLRESNVLDAAVSSALVAYRWRYAFVHALRHGSSEQVDVLMSKLLAHVPATASWVQHEAQQPQYLRGSAPPVANAIEAGTRILSAAKSWLDPWPGLLALCTEDGKLPPLGVNMMGQYLKSAWLLDAGTSRESVVHIAADDFEFGKAIPFEGPPSPLSGIKISGLPDSRGWPWEWVRREFQDIIEDYLENRKIFADIEMCWPELAWDFANGILGKGSTVDSQPIQRGDLESVIADYRSRFPVGEVIFGQHSICALTECEAFVADLLKRGVDVIDSPWPPLYMYLSADRIGKTTEQLLARLNAATRAALDIYEVAVRTHLPSMAPELNTYQLLPARIVGVFTPPDPTRGHDGEPRFRWHLEPLPAGSQNAARWDVVHDINGVADQGDDFYVDQLHQLRGDIADRITLYAHFGEPGTSSSTPACSLGLDLLCKDLSAFEWISSIPPRHYNTASIRPRYT